MHQNPFEVINRRFDTIEALLLEIANRNGQRLEDTSSSNPMTIEEVAAFLNLKKPTIYRMVSERTIPFSKPGKRLYFYKDELEQWIRENRKATRAEIKKSV